MKRRKAFVKAEREIQIINRIVEVYGLNIGFDVTAAQVASWLDIGATQARTLLRGLEVQGVLVSKEIPYPGVCRKSVRYSLTMEYILNVDCNVFSVGRKRERHIKINGNQVSYEVQL